jgi:hypothetical protein
LPSKDQQQSSPAVCANTTAGPNRHPDRTGDGYGYGTTNTHRAPLRPRGKRSGPISAASASMTRAAPSRCSSCPRTRRWRSPRSSPLRTTRKRPVPVDPRGALPAAFRPGRRVSHRSMVKRP